VLLKAAQNVKAIVATPWLLLPGLFVVAMILSFNFLGDEVARRRRPLQVAYCR